MDGHQFVSHIAPPGKVVWPLCVLEQSGMPLVKAPAESVHIHWLMMGEGDQTVCLNIRLNGVAPVVFCLLERYASITTGRHRSHS